MILEFKDNNILKRGNKSLKFKAINSRFLGIKSFNSTITPLYEKHEIVGFNWEDVEFRQGDSIKLWLSTGSFTLYHIQNFRLMVVQGTIEDYDLILIQEDLNKSVFYILPTLGYNFKFFGVTYRLLNGFVSSDYSKIYLKYRFSNAKSFKDLERNLQEHPAYNGNFSTDPYNIIYSFKIPPIFKEDISLILQGKYSKISDRLKKRILNFNGELDFLEGVLYKNPVYKKYLEDHLQAKIPEDLDLDDKPNLQLELWNNEHTI